MRPARSINRARSAGRRAAALAALLALTSVLASACGSSSKSTTASTASVPPPNVVTGPSGHPTSRGAKISAATAAAYVRFAQCMRAKGIGMPEPNIKGPGPIFDPRKIDTKNPHFASATVTCRAALVAAR